MTVKTELLQTTSLTPRGPTDQQRTIIIGRTGSGKSVFACALLSTRNFDEMPWIIFDFKGEDLIEDILKACKGSIKFLSPKDKPPKSPGLYYMKLTPVIDLDDLEAFLWKVHKQGNVGLLIDEGYCIPANSPAFNTILTQGRSLHIPVIALYQRPVYMSRFAVAQADFVAAFEQMDERDMKTAASFVRPFIGEDGRKITVFDTLPKYECLWYDVGRGTSSVLAPAPPPEVIINRFKARLAPRKQRALI